MPDTNFHGRKDVALPVEVSSEIIQKVQEGSAVMQLARQIDLPGPGLSVNIIDSDPEAEWVAEGAKKPVKKGSFSTKKITPYKLAVIVPFSEEFTRDAAALYSALVARIPMAMAEKFDATVFGSITKPGENFDQLNKVTAQDLADPIKALVAADLDISEHGGITNGYALSPKAKAILLTATDDNGRPLFVDNIAQNGVPTILGAPTHISKGCKTTDAIAYAGDWTKAVYGVTQALKMTPSDQATLTLSDGSTINLWQQNMVAIRAEMEIGFRADTTVFNRFTYTEKTTG